MSKPWIDVGTTAIPRLTTRECMEQLVASIEDRRDFNLRWVFHLDPCPIGKGSKARFEPNVKMARETAGLFDDAVIMIGSEWMTYGGSVWAVLNQLKHPVLWIEDDKLFVRSFSIQRLLELTQVCDYVLWTRRPIHKQQPYVGTTAPSFWTTKYWTYMLEHYPTRHRRITERALMQLMAGSGMTSVFYDREPDWCDVGKTKLAGYHRGPHSRFWEEDGIRYRCSSPNPLDDCR